MMHFPFSSTLYARLFALRRLGSISGLCVLAGACSSAAAPGRTNDLALNNLAFTGHTTVTTNPAAMTVVVTGTNMGTTSASIPGDP